MHIEWIVPDRAGTALRLLLVTVMLGGAAPVAASDPQAERLQQRALRYFAPLPATMPGAEHDTPARIALGEKLFHEPRLSSNDSQSCASCHRIGAGDFGVDNLPLSPGAHGQVGDRNTPTVLNAGWQKSQFWDGRARDLADQAGQPILNPVEMAMPDEQAVVDKLAGITEYQAAFARAFPDAAEPLSFANLREALAAFQRTLRSPARFDDFLNGDLSALDSRELRGLYAFIRVNCVRCHDGGLLGGESFELLGKYEDFPNQADTGRQRVTGNEEDRMFFKTAPLRNVARTGPWFHDGSVASLEEVIRIMAQLQLDKNLEDDVVEDIAAFLGALTDTTRH